MSAEPDITAKAPRLMRAIRAAMAGTESVQERLDHFVEAITTSMDVKVASIYLLRDGEDLELSATQGLKRSAVHKTRLKKGEGLVGHVALTARPLNLADAYSHPLFSYREETGEDPYKSFLGVPILRGGRVLGVLVVQSRITLNPIKPESMQGKAFADGLVRGTAYLHLPPVPPANLLAENVTAEQARLEVGITELRSAVDAMVSGEAASISRASKEIYESYRLFAYDRKWVGRLREAVQSGLTSEAAVERVRNEHRARLMKARDPYLRARLHDLEDLANRLLRALMGENISIGNKNISDDAIIFARDIGPAELLDYDRNKLKGMILEEGAASSHTAIICQAIGVPLIGRVEGVLDHIATGDEVLLDGEAGIVHIRPVESQVAGFELRINIRGEINRAYDAIRLQRAVTKDGREISLQLNAGLVVDLPQIELSGADGIGLFRTEFQFMVSEFMPKLKEQTELYKQAIDAAGDRPVTFRTLDLGGDKILPYMDPVPEENPAIGWRAIRIALDRPGLMRHQLRALIAAGAERHLRVMFPMVATVDEFIAARALFDKEVQRASNLGRKLPNKIEVGVMLETPSLAWQINAICDHADFVSVGANDLMQFFFAADRDNPRVSDRYDPLHPAALSIMQFVAAGCKMNNKPSAVCGAMASRPIEAITLIALGYDTLSMPVTGIGPVKSAVLALDAQKLANRIKRLITLNSRLSSVRDEVKQFCLEEGVPV